MGSIIIQGLYNYKIATMVIENKDENIQYFFMKCTEQLPHDYLSSN